LKQAIILAGGKGTRLRERLKGLPKPLINISGVPLLERQILLLKKYRFTDVIILVNYEAHKIIDFCNVNNNWGLNILCVDDGEPAGTAGAVLNCFDKLNIEFLVMYGDTMLDVDLDRFYSYHAMDKKTAATLFLHPNDHPNDSDLISVDDENYINAFYPYPHEQYLYYPNLVNAALYWIRKDGLSKYVNYINFPLDFAKDLFPLMVKNGSLLRGYNCIEYIKDCGTPERVDIVSRDITSGKVKKSSLENKQKAIFIDRDGTLNVEVSHLTSMDKLELLPNVGQSLKKINSSDYRAILVTNQPVIARGDCSKEQLKQIHNKLETILGKCGAFIDRIYYCPHYPVKGFAGEIESLKVKCACRKPSSGMIDKAVLDFNISIEDSWLIGDTTTDVETAKRCKLKSVLVQTGYGGLDEKFDTVPDFIVPDFNAAVTFILSEYDVLCKRFGKLIKEINKGELLFIGGQSRSGKSSLANMLKILKEKRGFKCHVISTDAWLLSEQDRKHGSGVLEKHNIDQLSMVISGLQNRKSVFFLNIPSYRKLSRKHLPNTMQLEIDPEDVIIIEGVIALHLADMFQEQNKIYVDIDELVRKQRVLNEYLMRGYTDELAIRIYNERFEEEVDWVKNTASNSINIKYFETFND
jgi:histidinol-phosphate phosphatase family protein